MKLKLMCAVFCLAFSALAQVRTNGINLDESKVPPYTLPDPLVCADGTRVTSAGIWEEKRRPELVKIFEEQIYGRAPGRPRGMHFAVTSFATNALGGIATRKEVTIWFTRGTNGPGMHLLIYAPNTARKPVPAFLGFNFSGNHAINADPGITLSDRWLPAAKNGCVTNNRATDACRGQEATQWPVEKILARGYALATVYYGDLEPDFTNGWKLGVRAALSPQGTNTVFKPDAWGAISAWAWGLSRALDYLETDRAIDARHVAVIGHSRLAKTALWAGAHDQRFAIVIANESGAGGAALARRWFGQTTADINRKFPHWFCGNFKKYSDHDDEMPADQHEVVALVAPRPVYIASAEGDHWSDPRGEFLGAQGAEPVYQLFGEAGLGVSDWPPVGHPVGDFIGYHIRTGRHDLTDYDWEQYLNFADRHFKR
jgi:hypothetical protein